MTIQTTIKIEDVAPTPVVNISLDTIRAGKQALVFVNTKRAAERQAEDIAAKIKETSDELITISDKALNTLSRPTKQCRRLSLCLKKGIAFHHAGLAAAQRELVEDNFRNSKVKVICCTPTLAAGLDLPAFRAVIRDLKRYGHRGLQHIPVLEYHQMSGRAGRPKYDSWGEAICIAETESQAEQIVDQFINGVPEDIFSKLAVEPVFRTYLLSLISSNLVNDLPSIYDFFSNTFWAYQYEDMDRLKLQIDKTILMLSKWSFVKTSIYGDDNSDFMDANALSKDKVQATLIGKRVSELYLDPLTANHLITCIKRTTAKMVSDFGLLQCVSNTLEMRPLLRVKTKEYEDIQEFLAKQEDNLLDLEPTLYDPEYDTFLNSVKTSMFMYDWINEKDEEDLLEKYDIRPGEIRVKLTSADWLLYSLEELSKLSKIMKPITEIKKLRLRMKHGAKEELLTLLKLKQIGRVRARILYRNKLHSIKDVKNAPLSTLSKLLGSAVSKKVKNQLA